METTCSTCGDLLLSDSARCYRCSGKGTSQSGASILFSIIGGLILVVGIILLIGNVTGILPTFPFAGFILTTVGGIIMGLGD